MAKSLTNVMLAVACAVTLLLTSGCGGKDSAPEKEATPDTYDLRMALSNRMKAAKDIGNPVAQAEEYLTIARELQLIKDLNDSVAPLRNTVKASSWVPQPADQGRVLAECAAMFVRAKKPDEAKKAYDKAATKLAEVPDTDPAGQAMLLAQLAWAEQELGKADDAKKNLKTAEDKAKQVEATEKERRCLALMAVTQAAKKMGDTATAKSASGNLLNWLEETPPAMQAELSIAAASLLKGVTEDKSEEKLLQAGIDAAQKIEDKPLQAKLLVEAASVRNAWSQPAKAHVLLDQVEKLLPAVKDKGQLETLKAKVKIGWFHVDRMTEKKS